MASAKNFFSADEQAAIIATIHDAEALTSGEIRLHLEETCGKDVLLRATAVFHKLKLHETALKNGVLIYLAVKDKRFAILGDAGINKVVPEGFWDDIKTEMQQHFAAGDFLQGIISAITESGKHLAAYFPVSDDDKNELSDEISFDND